jgi:enamine deaminase RidA (YjgF/YER057c/UK114 family)
MAIERPYVPQLFTPVGYCSVTVATGTRLIHCSGQIALDSAGALIGKQDLTMQSRQAVNNLIMTLKAADATFKDVIKMTMYVVNLNDDSLNQIFVGATTVAKEFGQSLPLTASTVVGVQRLAHSEALLEIEAVALLP